MHVLALSAPVTGAIAGPEPYIAKYLHDKDAAFSITCDDGYSHQVENTVEILDPLGLKATFFIMPLAIEQDDTGQLVSWERVKELQAEGHEIGTHARIDTKLHLTSDDTLDYIVNGGYRLIKEKTGIAPVSFASPGGSKLTKRVQLKVMENHYFIRSTTILPGIRMTGYGSIPGKREWSGEKARRDLLATVAERGWRIAILHSIIKGWSPFKSKDECREHFTWAARQKNLWVAPLGTVARYVYAQRQARLNVHRQEQGLIEFSVLADVRPDSVFNSPLTVVIPVSASSAGAHTADDADMPLMIEPDKILVDVPADGTRFRVEWK